MKKGKLIVIDGIDGSGKATQTAFLVKSLRKKRIKVRTIDFPSYHKNFFGKLIGDYLSGIYGDFTKVDPRVASVLYAADRFESGEKIKKWLKEGCVVIADRYTSANQIHQGGKIKDLKERRIFLNWLESLEYSVFKIPKPDLVIFLDVPVKVSRKWLEKKISDRRKKGRRDVAEENLRYLKNSRESGLFLEKKNKNWKKISCCDGMVCMLPEEIHQHVINLVEELI